MLERKKDIEFLIDYLGKLQEGLKRYSRMVDDPEFDHLELPPSALIEDRKAAKIAESVGIKTKVFLAFIKFSPKDTRYERWQKVIKQFLRKYRTTIKIIEKMFTLQDQEKLPSHYKSCVEMAAKIRKRPDVLAKALKRAELDVRKVNRKNYCNPKHVRYVYQKEWDKYQKKYGRD